MASWNLWQVLLLSFRVNGLRESKRWGSWPLPISAALPIYSQALTESFHCFALSIQISVFQMIQPQRAQVNSLKPHRKCEARTQFSWFLGLCFLPGCIQWPYLVAFGLTTNRKAPRGQGQCVSCLWLIPVPGTCQGSINVPCPEKASSVVLRGPVFLSAHQWGPGGSLFQSGSPHSQWLPFF